MIANQGIKLFQTAKECGSIQVYSSFWHWTSGQTLLNSRHPITQSQTLNIYCPNKLIPMLLNFCGGTNVRKWNRDNVWKVACKCKTWATLTRVKIKRQLWKGSFSFWNVFQINIVFHSFNRKITLCFYFWTSKISHPCSREAFTVRSVLLMQSGDHNMTALDSGVFWLIRGSSLITCVIK